MKWQASPRTSEDGVSLRRLGFFFGLLFFWLFFTGLLGGFAGFRLLLAGFLFFLEQRFLFFFAGRAVGDVALAVEVDTTIHQRFLVDRISAEWVMVEYDKICGLSCAVRSADRI